MKQLYLSATLLLLSFFMGQPLSSLANDNQTPQFEIDSLQQVLVPQLDNLLVIEDLYPEMSLDNRKPLLLIHGWNFDGEPAPVVLIGTTF